MAATSAADNDDFSANTASLLSALGAPSKRTADEANLSGNPAEPAVPRPEAPVIATVESAPMEVETHEGSEGSQCTMLALLPADGLHFNGSTQIDRHTVKLQEECKLTRDCLEKSTHMDKLGEQGFDIINGRCGAKTCIMIMMYCATTAKALLHRFKEGGFLVKQEGKVVAYKMMNGKEWYKLADHATNNKKTESEVKTHVVVLRGLPLASACIPIYTPLLVAHFGSLSKGVIINGHELGGVKTDKTDGSLTFVLNDELNANTVPTLPFIVDGHAFGDMRWDKNQATLSHHKVCEDKNCLGFDGFHIETCKAKTIIARNQMDKSTGILKTFQRLIATNEKEVNAVRAMVEHIYNDKICRSFRRKGIPCKSGSCATGPCVDWEELIEDKLSDTIYANMPDSIRPGKVFHRGGRGSGKAKAKTKFVNKENESEEEEEGQYYS